MSPWNRNKIKANRNEIKNCVFFIFLVHFSFCFGLFQNLQPEREHFLGAFDIFNNIFGLFQFTLKQICLLWFVLICFGLFKSGLVWFGLFWFLSICFGTWSWKDPVSIIFGSNLKLFVLRTPYFSFPSYLALKESASVTNTCIRLAT